MCVKATGQEVIKNMEYLIKLLHREWKRSGKTKLEAVICLDEVEKINQRFVREINDRQILLENENLIFKQSIDMSKEGFILLRLVKKFKEAEEKVNQKRAGSEVSIELDKEEFNMIQSILRE